MNRCLALSLLSFGLSLSCCFPPPRLYHYVNLPMNWVDAQQYCREKYTDLATIVSMDDISRLQPDFPFNQAWIGLRDDPTVWKRTLGNNSNSWRWSATGETSKTGYQNWRSGEPNTPSAEELCVTMVPGGVWMDEGCNIRRWFVCYIEKTQTEKTYVHVRTRKKWTEARDYCRQHYTDLAVIENEQENNQVFSAMQVGSYAWIGLSRVPWSWSDKTQSSFKHWNQGEPNNAGGAEFCVGESHQHGWNDIDCSKTLPFICHQVPEKKIVVRMNFKTDADLIDPAANTQILQQLQAMLTRQGLTNVTLRWKIQPKKEGREKPEPDNILHV